MNDPVFKYEHDVVLWLDGTEGMKPDLVGTYITIVNLIYLRGGKTVRDDRALAGRMDVSKRMATSLTNKLISLGKILQDGNYLLNPKASRVVNEHHSQKFRAKNKGRKAAEMRWRSNDINDLQMLGACHAGAREKDNINFTKLRDNISPPYIPPPRSEHDPLKPWMFQIPADQPISDDEKKFALDRGWDLGKIDDQWGRFKNHYRGKGIYKTDWTSTWKNWVTSPYQGQSEQNGKTQTRNSTDARSYLAAARKAMPE